MLLVCSTACTGVKEQIGKYHYLVSTPFSDKVGVGVKYLPEDKLEMVIPIEYDSIRWVGICLEARKGDSLHVYATDPTSIWTEYLTPAVQVEQFRDNDYAVKCKLYDGRYVVYHHADYRFDGENAPYLIKHLDNGRCGLWGPYDSVYEGNGFYVVERNGRYGTRWAKNGERNMDITYADAVSVCMKPEWSIGGEWHYVCVKQRPQDAVWNVYVLNADRFYHYSSIPEETLKGFCRNAREQYSEKGFLLDSERSVERYFWH